MEYTTKRFVFFTFYVHTQIKLHSQTQHMVFVALSVSFYLFIYLIKFLINVS